MLAHLVLSIKFPIAYSTKIWPIKYQLLSIIPVIEMSPLMINSVSVAVESLRADGTNKRSFIFVDPNVNFKVFRVRKLFLAEGTFHSFVLMDRTHVHIQPRLPSVRFVASSTRKLISLRIGFVFLFAGSFSRTLDNFFAFTTCCFFLFLN